MRDTALVWSGRENVFGSGQIASMTEHPSVNSISWPWGWRLRHLVYTQEEHISLRVEMIIVLLVFVIIKM